MNKTKLLLSGLLLTAAVLTGCDNEQVLPPVTYPEGGDREHIATGAWNDPYYIWQVLAGVKIEEVNYSYAWVHGYVVGYIDTSKGSKLNATTATFASGGVASNILLAESPDEKDWTKCIPVQLNWGSDSRDLSVSRDNGASLGKEVCVYGLTGNKYRTIYGVRDCSYYAYGSKGYPIASSDNTYLSDGLGEFTIENVTLPSGLPYAWKWDTSYSCATASGYYSNSRYATDSYLVSPEIEFQPGMTATFSQAIGYLNQNELADFLEVCVRVGKDGEWVVVGVDMWPDTTSNFNWARGCEIDLYDYVGKTIQIGFHYKSTTAVSPTWEIKNLIVE